MSQFYVNKPVILFGKAHKCSKPNVTRFLYFAGLFFFLSSADFLRRKVGERTTGETVGLSYMSCSATVFLTSCVSEGRHNDPIKANVSCLGQCVDIS